MFGNIQNNVCVTRTMLLLLSAAKRPVEYLKSGHSEHPYVEWTLWFFFSPFKILYHDDKAFVSHTVAYLASPTSSDAFDCLPSL